ncbi:MULTISPECIES: phage holin family protein [Enterobacterales]|uniref:phage holin family protein n=1 Tax=Enterobacterales TaxID=91347 RepID=UPI001113058B|nr:MULTISPECIES: phage holin family protein [Enterobacterales]WPF05633.1 phage holin family protein [Proteus vulgaris]
MGWYRIDHSLCVEISELLSAKSMAGLSSIASNLFLCALVIAAKGNVMQVFKKVKQ